MDRDARPINEFLYGHIDCITKEQLIAMIRLYITYEENFTSIGIKRNDTFDAYYLTLEYNNSYIEISPNGFVHCETNHYYTD